MTFVAFLMIMCTVEYLVIVWPHTLCNVPSEHTFFYWFALPFYWPFLPKEKTFLDQAIEFWQWETWKSLKNASSGPLKIDLSFCVFSALIVFDLDGRSKIHLSLDWETRDGSNLICNGTFTAKDMIQLELGNCHDDTLFHAICGVWTHKSNYVNWLSKVGSKIKYC